MIAGKLAKPLRRTSLVIDIRVRRDYYVVVYLPPNIIVDKATRIGCGVAPATRLQAFELGSDGKTELRVNTPSMSQRSSRLCRFEKN